MQIKFKFNINGIFGILLILSIFVVAYLLNWNINIWYFTATISIYSLAIVVLVWNEEYYRQQQLQIQQQLPPPPQAQQQPGQQRRLQQLQQQREDNEVVLFNLRRIKIGWHFAFIFSAISLYIVSTWIYKNDVQITISFFIIAIVSGMAIPFILLRRDM